MFREYLNRILGSERGSGSNRQVYATPDVIEKVVHPLNLFLPNTRKI